MFLAALQKKSPEANNCRLFKIRLNQGKTQGRFTWSEKNNWVQKRRREPI